MKKQNDSTNGRRCRWASFDLVTGLRRTQAPLAAGLAVRPASSWLALAVYVTGLITQTNVTATAIAATVGVVSHDGLTRLLQGLGWGLSRGACLAVRVVQALGVEGYRVVDDILLPKPFARLIAFCGWDYDHSQRCYPYGQRLVFVVWSTGWLTIPLVFAFWQKNPAAVGSRRRRRRRPKGRRAKGSSAHRRRRGRPPQPRRIRLATGCHYRTKNELARALVWTVGRRGVPSRFILFDNGYFSKKKGALFERLHLIWITRATSNTQVWFPGQSLTVKQVAAWVSKANYHYDRARGARVRSFEVQRHGRRLKLTVITDDTGPEGGRTKYLLTNDLTLTNQEHVQWYRKRWVIEIFFRDAKQALGLAKCEARTPEAVINHVVLVCVAYAFLHLLKPLAADHRPSVRASQDALAPLVMLVRQPAGWQVAWPSPLVDGRWFRLIISGTPSGQGFPDWPSRNTLFFLELTHPQLERVSPISYSRSLALFVDSSSCQSSSTSDTAVSSIAASCVPMGIGNPFSRA